MDKRTFYYARVSSSTQNLSRQLEAFKKMGAQEREVIVDKKSGKDFEREGYKALRNAMLRKGDTLVIKSLDRLSRDKKMLKDEIKWLLENGIRLKVIDVPTSMIEVNTGQEWIIEMINNILIEVLSSIAQTERETILQRQKEGIEIAKLQGRHLGRPKAMKPHNWDAVYNRWRNNEITARKAMQELNLKHSTFYKFIKQIE